MIKFDRDVHQALRSLEKAGFETYAAGECVREVVRGEMTYDWDLLTAATLEDMKKIFPEAEVLSESAQEIRLDFTYEVTPEDDDEPSYIEGVICDVHHISGNIEDLMKNADFTLNAMADNPERAFVDPCGGRDDIKAKLIRTIEPADAVFKANPILMMEAISLGAELGYDLQKSVFEGILANWRLLLDYDVKAIREQLERVLVSNNAGKGLNLMAESGLMAVVFGEEISKKMSHNDMQAFETVCENIDKTKPVKRRRLGLLYTALSKKKAFPAIERLQFDAKTDDFLHAAVEEMIDIQFLHDEQTFKRYLHKMGLEKYNYLHNLSKAQRIVYDQPTVKIESRNYLMQTVMAKHEPIFVEDLVIDSNDILEAGITDDAEKAEELLNQVVAVVHRNPKNNERTVLLKTAKKYAKNPFAAKTRYVHWLR